MTNKWEIPGWGDAQGQIREAVHFLCKDKIGVARAEVIDEVVDLVRTISRGDEPAPKSNPIDQEQYERESWARATARHIIGGALRATERSEDPLPSRDQVSLLREIARLALWHIPNSHDEVRNLTRNLDLENLKQPHPRDDPPGRD